MEQIIAIVYSAREVADEQFFPGIITVSYQFSILIRYDQMAGVMGNNCILIFIFCRQTVVFLCLQATGYKQGSHKDAGHLYGRCYSL